MAVRGFSRRGAPPSLEVDRESFIKTQTISIQKAINQQEVAAKEKHVRNAILGTHQEHGAQTFWHVIRRLQLSTHAITCWKFCHVLHKILRDGHENSIAHSIKYIQQLKDLGGIWGHAMQSFGKLITKYTKFLVRRLEFHKKYKEFPGNLSITDDTLDKIGNSDINAYFELCVDILDCLETLMELQETIFSSLDLSRSNSMTGPGQCRLAPCIPIILDSSMMYDYAVKVLFKLHSCLPPDTLCGHRQRFLETYNKLKKFYFSCSNMQYFKRLIQVPLMPDSPPNFLLTMERSHQLGPVKILTDPPTTEVDRTPSPEPEPELIVTQPIDTNFDVVFGADLMGDFSFNKETDEKDEIIRQLREEINFLKRQSQMMTMEHQQEIGQLLDRIHELERDLEGMKRKAKNDDDKMKKLEFQVQQASELSEGAAKTQSLLAEFEKKALSNEEMYKKMKDKHINLVKEHADLLRKNAETKKQTDHLQQNADMMQESTTKFEKEIENLQKILIEKEIEANKKENERKEHHDLLFVSAVEATEMMICNTVSALDDPVNAQSICSAESLIKMVQSAVNSAESLETSAFNYFNSSIQNPVIQALSLFGHHICQTLLNGIATCHLVSENQGHSLNHYCHSLANEALSYLAKLKNYKTYDIEEVTGIQSVKSQLENILTTAMMLLPKMTDIVGKDLQDLVEQEMASTSQAIESAAGRIEKMLRDARERDSGVNLEVNERILDSCTELMEAIRILIISSKDLQREIVDEGRGASTTKEFYMKNSRWTEGLISAAKAVGLGATLLTDSADQAVTGEGKFEEIIVCSHEIAASTAQLVAASRVKADKRSERLPKLQKASKEVNTATAKVVASTNSARQQIEESSDATLKDISKMTLTQIKRREMDCQVRLLELEQALQLERIKIGKYRKQHYVLSTENEQSQEPKEDSSHDAESNKLQTRKNPNDQSRKKPPLPEKPLALQSL